MLERLYKEISVGVKANRSFSCFQFSFSIHKGRAFEEWYELDKWHKTLSFNDFQCAMIYNFLYRDFKLLRSGTTLKNIITCSKKSIMIEFTKTEQLFRLSVFLDPRPYGPINFVIAVLRNRLVWPGWSINPVDKRRCFNFDTTSHDVVSTLRQRRVSTGKIIHKDVVILKIITYTLNRRIFLVLFVQGTFST